MRFFRFVLVGFSGVFINQFFLWLFITQFGFFYAISSIFAVQLAMMNNFLWNILWTFRDRIVDKGMRNNLLRLAKYNIVNWSLDIFNVIFLITFTEAFNMNPLYSNLIALAIVTSGKYILNLRWTFPVESIPIKIFGDTKLSLIIPTYNEKNNIIQLLVKIRKELQNSKLKNEIIIVDDSSPDKTYELVRTYKKKFANIKLLVRKQKMGLSSAIVEGIKHASGNIICVMDADFSHPPELIPPMVRKISDNSSDLVIGSRFVKGGKSLMGIKRDFTSRLASLFVWPLTFTKDPLSGFFAFKKDVIQNLKLNSRGFKILLEILVKDNHTNVIELPYTFNKRKSGKSKLSLSEMRYFLTDCLKLYFWRARSFTL